MKYLKYVISIIILSVLAYKATIRFTPNVIYNRVKSTMLSSSSIKENQIRIVPFPEADYRAVVMPNPDFAYLSLFYNLEKGPLHLKGIMPDSTYWSVALYETNTSNHFIKNDLQFATNELDIAISHSDHFSGYNISKDAEVIESPSKSGFLLVRILGTRRTTQEREHIINLMKSVKVEQLL